jgi:hypothetical protein
MKKYSVMRSTLAIFGLSIAGLALAQSFPDRPIITLD